MEICTAEEHEMKCPVQESLAILVVRFHRKPTNVSKCDSQHETSVKSFRVVCQLDGINAISCLGKTFAKRKINKRMPWQFSAVICGSLLNCAVLSVVETT